MPLQQKSIVIIGGTSGLGLSAALACVRAGASLVIAGREDGHATTAQQALPKDTLVLTGDASEPALAELAVSRAVEQFGKLDGLYHVAGASGRQWGDGPLDAITDAAWQQTLAANLNSVFYSNRAAAQQFLQQGTGGSVLNVSSVLAFAPAPQHFATHAYTAAKGAIISLTQSCAAYYAPQKIRFNVLAPGLVETPMSARACRDPDILRYLAVRQPLASAGVTQASDLDDAVMFFLSDNSRMVTGQVLSVDGGWSVTQE